MLWVWVVLWVSLASCSRNSQMDVEDWEDTEAVLVNTEVAPNDVIGTWHGFIPCPGCRGYTYDLVLMDNYNFEERVIYEDQPGEPVTRIGTWSVTDGIVELSGDEAARTRFSLSTAGELRALDLAGKPINQNLQAQYSLKRSAGLAEDESPLWEGSRKAGVDFVATGHAPGWVLEIDKENEIVFTTRPQATVQLKAKTPNPTMDGSKTLYRANAETGELTVELLEQKCADAMSGKERPYSVRVTANGVVYTGCGLYLGAEQSK